MIVNKAKQALRAEAKSRRRTAHRALGAGAGELVRARFLSVLAPDPGTPLGGYWPMADELDSGPLLTFLHQRGCVCALPAVTGAGEPLVFRAWRPGAALHRGGLGEPTPDSGEPRVEPTWLLVPLLAFDRRGYRLGYGAGFYDRTIERLRGAGQLTAVGLAFSAQEIAEVPHDDRDQRLDWVVTETAGMKTR